MPKTLKPKAGDLSQRAAIRKTYKLYIGGQYPRSESGRAFEVSDAKGAFLANAAWASRKDARDAVSAARSAQSGWAKRTAYNRGQILYRIAEMMESRLDEFAEEIRRATGVSLKTAQAETQLSIDRWVYYAGWSDKWSALLSSVNPVAAPIHNFTQVEATGVVGLFCPDDSPLLALASMLAPVIMSGNSAFALISEKYPTVGMIFAEALPVSDVPAGVINLLSGYRAELLDPIASHLDVDALGYAGLPQEQVVLLNQRAADSVKRVFEFPMDSEADWRSEAAQGLSFVEPFVEAKTVWHPMGY